MKRRTGDRGGGDNLLQAFDRADPWKVGRRITHAPYVNHARGPESGGHLKGVHHLRPGGAGRVLKTETHPEPTPLQTPLDQARNLDDLLVCRSPVRCVPDRHQPASRVVQDRHAGRYMARAGPVVDRAPARSGVVPGVYICCADLQFQCGCYPVQGL